MAGAESSKDKRKGQYRLQIKARRAEYQDMMYSMKQAGLNPILASGATPGHMSVGTGESDVPAYVNSAVNTAKVGLDAYKANPEVDRNQSSSSLARAQAANTAADTNNRLLSAPNIPVERDRLQADAEQMRTAAGLNRVKSTTEAKQQGFITENTARARVEKELAQQDLQGRIGGNISHDPIGYGVNAITQGAHSAQDAKKAVATWAEQQWERAQQSFRDSLGPARDMEKHHRTFNRKGRN